MVEVENGDVMNEEGVGEDQVFTLEMVEQYTMKLKDIHPGKIVRGTILSVGAKGVVVDVGYKSEGIIPNSEFRDQATCKPGEEIDVLIEHMEGKKGTIVLSKERADQLLNWSKMVQAQKDDKSVKGKVFKRVKGGFMVDVGMEAFLPASQVDLKPLADPKEIMDQVFEFRIVKIDEARRNVVLSRRKLLEEARRYKKDELLVNLKIGDIKKGVVRNIMDFGVFVDLNGIDGLLHITDMTWGRISHPSELVAIGDEMEVMILNIDKEKEKISLGMKQTTTDPWESVEEKYPIGTRVKVRVVNIVPYGAFVELEKGIEGLIHVSELSWTKRVNNPSDILAVGDTVEALILSIDVESKRISMGVKQIEPNPWTKVQEKYSLGSTVTGKVRNLTNYGAFIELEEGIDGLIHVSDMSWTKKVEHPSEIVKKGDIVEVKVINVDPNNQRIALGLKQLQPDPWAGVEERFQEGAIVNGKVTKLAPFGVFVELEEGIEGLIHASQLPEKNDESDESVELKEGDEIAAKIVSVSIEERKIALSMKE